MAGSRQAPDCQPPEISPASMSSPGAQSSVFLSVCKPKDIYPRVLVSVHGSIVLTYPGRPARQPRHLHTFVAFFSTNKPPQPWIDQAFVGGTRPFRIGAPAINEFPSEIWGRIAANRARNFRSWLKKEADRRGYPPLRDAIAEYLRTSRGVRCTAEQIVLVSGIQQALDLLARLLLKKMIRYGWKTLDISEPESHSKTSEPG